VPNIHIPIKVAYLLGCLVG